MTLNDENIKKNIGATIRAARINSNLTQYALAEKVEIDEKQLSRLESGKHYPTLKTLLAIISALNMKLTDFENVKQELKTSAFYELVDILRTSSEEEIKQYLIIIKAIKELKK